MPPKTELTGWAITVSALLKILYFCLTTVISLTRSLMRLYNVLCSSSNLTSNFMGIDLRPFISLFTEAISLLSAFLVSNVIMCLAHEWNFTPKLSTAFDDRGPAHWLQIGVKPLPMSNSPTLTLRSLSTGVFSKGDTRYCFSACIDLNWGCKLCNLIDCLEGWFLANYYLI